jgi:hypothetical protein
VGTCIFKIRIENYVQGKRKPPMIKIHPFKEKEKEGGEGRSQFDGQWEVPLLSGPWKVLMLNGQWKVLMLNGQWKVPMLSGQWKVLMLSGQWEEKEKHLFTSSHFPPQQILLKPSFFQLILRFYFTMVLSHYLRISIFFLDL